MVASQHTWAFRQFGLAAAALDAVPLANWMTAFSNTVGAALWAADQEAAGRVLVRGGGGREGGGGAGLQQGPLSGCQVVAVSVEIGGHVVTVPNGRWLRAWACMKLWYLGSPG